MSACVQIQTHIIEIQSALIKQEEQRGAGAEIEESKEKIKDDQKIQREQARRGRRELNFNFSLHFSLKNIKQEEMKAINYACMYLSTRI